MAPGAPAQPQDSQSDPAVRNLGPSNGGEQLRAQLSIEENQNVHYAESGRS
jgi:hypothetical protein